MAKKTKYVYKVSNKQIDLNYREGETDAQFYKRLAKATDQRLVRIEELSGLRGNAPEPGFENAYKYAYRKAIDSLDKGLRYNANIPKPGTFEWRERINAMREFLSAPTSTKMGIKQVYGKHAETINKRYGTNFTPEQLADYFERGDYDKLQQKTDFGSKTVLRAIGKIQRAQKAVKEGLEKHQLKAGVEDEAALSILRKRSLKLYKDMSPEEIEEIRKLIRNL